MTPWSVPGRTITLRRLFVAIVVGASVYVAGLTAVVSLRIAPNFAMVRRNSMRVLSLYDEMHRRSVALADVRQRLAAVVAEARRGRSRTTAPALAALRDTLRAVALEPGWTNLTDVPTQLQAALIGGAEVGSRLANTLLVAISAAELGRQRVADSLLASAGVLEELNTTHRLYTERIALLDMVRRERALSASSAAALRAILLWVAAGLLAAPLLALLVYRRFYRPLADLDGVMREVAAGNIEARAPVRRDDELGRLSAHFNELAGVLRLRAEEEQRRAQHQERERIFRLSPDLMATASVDGHFLTVNPAFERTLGYSAEELRGQPFLSYVHEDDRAASLAQLADLQGGRPAVLFRNRYRCRDGSYRWLSWDCDPPTDGVLYAVARDVTAQQEAEERQLRLQGDVQRAAREWTLTFDAIDHAILILDAAGRVVRVNQAAQRLAGRPFGEILGLTVGALGRGQPWTRAAVMADALRDGRRAESSQVTDPAGDRTWDIEAIAVPGGGDDRRVIVVLHEITALVQLQRSLRHSETMSAMGTLVAGVAHEVRNPLFSMTATLDAFEERFADGAESPRHLTVLRTQLTRLTALMQDLLEYGKPAALEMTAGDMTVVARQAADACGALAASRGVRVSLEVSPAVPRVTMDRPRLVQVFTNLITNAVQHSPPGGEVLLDMHLAHDGGNDLVECTVTDAGPGFAPEDVPRVFEPFYTRRRGGTGLGLSLVQRAVEQHGGTVRVGNAAAGGGMVVVRLPLRLP